MNASRTAILRRVTAVGAAVGVIAFVSAVPGFADSSSGSGVNVINTETVQVYMNSTGDVQSKRVYEQLALTGHGKVDLSNPISTDGFRNLDGFGGLDVQGHDQIVKTSVDGTQNYRSVSNFDKELPVSIAPAYYLDGKRVNPADVVGKSGKLEVEFTVKNLTTQRQQVSFPNGRGGTRTGMASVPVPMVGSLTTNLPSTFTNVDSGGANTAGDGAGGTTLSFTMTLFPPIGSTTAHFGYAADITNGIVPEVDVTLLPVDPMASPTFKSAGDSYKGGAETGTQLVAGAGKIDSNLLKLRDGAATLLAGLIKLRTGADQLHTGLAGTAVPGAHQLADGAGQLDTGLGKINDGASRLAGGSGQLADGARRLSAGAGDAHAGGKTLSRGAKQLSNGLSDANAGSKQLESGTADLAAGQKGLLDGMKQLRAGVANLPADVQKKVNADPQFQALTGALDQVIAGIGTLADQPQANPANNTLLGGLNALKYGLRYPGSADCVNAPATQCGVLDAVDRVRSGIDTQLQSAPQLMAALTAAYTSTGCQTDPVCKGNFDAVLPTLSALPGQLKEASDALKAASAGGDLLTAGINLMRSKISTGVSPLTCFTNPSQCGALEALQAIRIGIPLLVSQLSQSISTELLANIGDGAPGCDPTKTLLCASQALYDGSTRLEAGMNQLAAGLAQLNAGGLQLANGAGTLSSGLGQISTGADQLSVGAGKLHSGANQLADGTATAKDGSGRLADGADQLAKGLGAAADGSGQIAEGLGQAVMGAPQLVDGAQRLSTEGMGQLIAAGESTAQSYGKMYAELRAGAERAHTHSMAFGAPKGAEGLTAYSFVLQSDTGESGHDWTRGVAALVLLGLGGGAFALRRRLA